MNEYAIVLFEWLAENPDHPFLDALVLAEEAGQFEKVCLRIIQKMRVMDEHILLHGTDHTCTDACFLELELEESNG